MLTSEQPSPAAGPADKPAWLYCFQRALGTVQPSARASSTMQDSCLVEGDMVILSVEGSLRIQATILLHSDSTRLRKIWLLNCSFDRCVLAEHVNMPGSRDN